MTDPQPQVRRPGPSLVLAIVLIVAGAVLAVPAAVAGIVPIVRVVGTSAGFEAPGNVRVHLGRGTYMVFEDTGASSIGSAFSDPTPTITPGDVTVTDADNVDVEVLDRGSVNETRNDNGRRYVGAVRFRTPAAGTYVVSVHDVAPTAVLVARPLGDAIKSSLVWFALAGVGGIIFVVGIVLLIVGAVRRGRSSRAFAYAAPVPPGWHPDPGGSGRLRYWDGYRWTEHLH